MPNGFTHANGVTLHLTLLCYALYGCRRASAFVECVNAPNCSDNLRKPCNTAGIVPNVCGDCDGGTHGAYGPANTKCLLNESCALIFPGQTGCPAADQGSLKPFVVPFGRCTCDVGGLLWPTNPGACANLRVKMPSGSGIYTLEVCKTTTCEPSSCVTLAAWPPTVRPFVCETRGVDSVLLDDGCVLLNSLIGGRSGMSSLCGHPGMQAIDPKGREQQFPPPCELAPKCPESVLGNTRLEQSCCDGNEYSHPLTAWGREHDTRAPGFCSVSATSFGCPVITSGPGWRGCACLDQDGVPENHRICTVECNPPDCPLPANGIIRATPEEWLTSQVPQELGLANTERRKAEGSAWRAAEARLCILMVVFALSFLP
jgi:hypothetical protein